MYQPRRRKKRHTPGLKTVELCRSKNGFGFTISGQQPCILSCIVNNSPADRAGLKTGDHLVSVNGLNVATAGHDDVVKIIGSSTGMLILQIAETVVDSDSSGDEAPSRPKTKYPNRRMKTGPSKEKEVRETSSQFGKDRSSNQHHGANRYAPMGYKRHSSRSRALSPPNERPPSRLRGVENVNPLSAQVYPRRSRNQNVTKHTIITKDSRIVRSHSHPDTFHTYADFLKPPGGHTIAPQVAMTAQELSNVLYPSIQPHVSSSTQAANEEADSDGSSPPNLRVIVGYIGSIEMPRESNLAGWRLQSVRSAVRRLRVEQRIHTLVLMLIYSGGIRLTNTMGSTVAHYPTDKVAFSGGSADDKRFFGIVTVHGCNASEGSEYGSQDDYMFGSSCHVFMVDPELHPHNVHVSKARSFSVQCTRDPQTRTCAEFPTSAVPILRNVTKLYKDRQGGQYEAELAQGPQNNNNHIRSDSNTSTSDSGLGFANKEDRPDQAIEGNDQVYVVEIPNNDEVSGIWNANSSAFISPVSNRHDMDSMMNQDSFAVNAGSFIQPPDDEQMTVESLCQSHDGITDDSSVRLAASGLSDPSSSMINTSHSSTDLTTTGATPVMQKLSIMSERSSAKEQKDGDDLDTQNSADNLRRSAHRIMQSRQKHHSDSAPYSSDAESIRSTESAVSQKGSSGPAGGSVSASLPPKPVNNVSNNSSSSVNSVISASGASNASQDQKTQSQGDKAQPPGSDKLQTTPVRPKSAVPAPPVSNASLEPKNSQNPLQNKPPIPDRKPVVPQHRTPSLPPRPERPKSTPPMAGYSPAPLATDEDYDSDNNQNHSTYSFLESWDGKIEDIDDACGDDEVKKDEIFALFEKEQEKLGEPLSRAHKSGSLKQVRSKRRPALSSSHESLVVNDVEFGKSGKLGGATSITSITKGNENGTAQQEVVQNGIGGGTLGRVASWALGLDKLLKDPAGIATFTEFLKKEFSEENIVFWTECEKLKKIADLNERKRKAKELYDKHIAVSGSEPVNVDSHARQRALESLNDPKPSFEVSQTQIFTLMKTDSYPRFLKSDVYKESVLAEMENKPLPFTGVEEDKTKDDVKKMLKKSRSVTSSNSEEGDREEKRRKSLLPWARSKTEKRLAKTQTEGDLQKAEKKSTDTNEENNKRLSKGPLDLPDLNLISKEITNNNNKEEHKREESRSRHSSGRLSDNKFCRVLLPDGSTTVIYAKPGQQIRTALQKLCDRRNMAMASMDVYSLHSDKPLDLTKDISTMGSKEIRLERRVLLRIDLPNRKVIGMKAKPSRCVRDVLKPVLHKYGFKVDSMVVQNASSGHLIDMESLVSTIDNQRILIQSSEDFAEWGGFGNHRGKPPLPRSKSVTSEDRLETTEITGKEPVISDMLGSEHLPQFDELGVLDPEKKSEERGKGSTSTDDHRTSGIFSFIRRNSFGEKDARTKAKTRSNSQGAAPSHATDTAAPVQQLVHPPSSRGQQLQHAGVAPPTRRGGKDPEQERFFELLTKVQSHRLDDQRGLTAADLELPDFLKVNQKGHSRSSLSSQSSMPGAKRYRRHERRNSDSSLMDISPDSSRLSRSYSQDKMETDTRSVNSYESPSTNRIPYMDQSFSQEGVYPSHRDADTLFSGEHHSITQTPNYNDSRLMDKSLGDLGFGQNGSAIKGTTPLNKLPTRLSPHSKSASNSRVSVPPRMSRPDSRTSTQQERTVDPHSQTNQDSGRSRTSRAIGSPRGAQMRSVSVDRVMLQQQRVQSHSNHSNNANCNHQYHGGNHSNDQEMIPVATPSPTTHDLILAPDSSPEISSNVPHHHQNQPQSHQQSHPHSLKNGHANGHNHGPRPQPPPRTPRRSPRQTAPPQTPPHPDQPVKKTLVFEEEIPEVQISQVSYV